MDDLEIISYSFLKKEKLVSQKSIDKLFASGASFIAYPLRVVYCIENETEQCDQLAKILISVSKRKFKRAVKRNRVKRQMREAYRLNKHALAEALAINMKKTDIAFLFLKDELPDYAEIDKAMKKALAQIIGNMEGR